MVAICFFLFSFRWRGVAVDEVTSGMGKKQMPVGFTGLGFVGKMI